MSDKHFWKYGVFSHATLTSQEGQKDGRSGSPDAEGLAYQIVQV